MIVAFATLGCKVNHYETEAMAELFIAAGWTAVSFEETADVYVVNTCSVTQTSDAKSRNLIARAHKRNPDALIVAVGCYAQTSAESVAKLPGVGLVLGTSGRREIVQRVERALKLGAPPTLAYSAPEDAAFEPLSAVRDSHTRATLKIQDGCVNFCAYCIIPYARGPLRSRPLDDVTREVTALSREGYREIVLTGIHLASYGRDLGGCTLMDAIDRVSAVDGISRVRLGSLEPNFVTNEVVRRLAGNEKLCRQFHLSLQSGSDAVLRRMNRRYSTAEYRDDVMRLREAMPDCAITTDVIAGFCGETEEEHAASYAFCEALRFSRMHVFPFSLRKGTKAAAMPNQIPKAVKEHRAKELGALAKRMQEAYLLSRVGGEAEVLAESDGYGYSRDYIRVKTDAREGEIVRMRIESVRDGIAYGKEMSS